MESVVSMYEQVTLTMDLSRDDKNHYQQKETFYQESEQNEHKDDNKTLFLKNIMIP